MNTTQANFEAFMEAQMAAMISSGMEAEQWIEQHAAQFRADWDAAR